MKRGILVLLLSLLSACGGGGGGGSTPANLQSGSDSSGREPDIQSGVFKDSLVSGLRYEQGDISGVTDVSGSFSYDANSHVPVVFFVGNMRLGAVSGKPVVSPMDLDAMGEGVNLNHGINVARVLIALDVDGNPDNGIELPEDSDVIAGDLPFDLPPSDFSNDLYVKNFLRNFSIATLPGENDALEHMKGSPEIAEAISLSNAQLSDIDSVQLRWNSNLNQDGLLEHVAASDGEQLFVFVRVVDDVTRLSDVVYVDAAGHYMLMTVGDAGNIDFINIDGNVSKVLANMDGLPVDQVEKSGIPTYEYHNNGIFDIAHYSPQLQLMRVNVNDRGGVRNLQVRTLSQIDSVNGVLEKIDAGSADSDGVLNLAGLLAKDVEGIMCSEFVDCKISMLLGRFLQNAVLADPSALAKLAVADEVLFPDKICVPIPVSGPVGVCGDGAFVSDARDSLLSSVTGAVGVWSSSPDVQHVNLEISIAMDDPVSARLLAYKRGLINTPPVGIAYRGSGSLNATLELVNLKNGDVYYRIGSVAVGNFGLEVIEARGEDSPVFVEDPDPVQYAQMQAAADDLMADCKRIFQHHGGILASAQSRYSAYLFSDLAGGPTHNLADEFEDRLSLVQARYVGAMINPWLLDRSKQNNNYVLGYDPALKVLVANFSGELYDPRLVYGSASFLLVIQTSNVNVSQ